MKKPTPFDLVFFCLLTLLLPLLIIPKFSVNANETNLDEFNKRIRLFLARYVDDDSEVKGTLERAEPNITVKMPVDDAAMLVKDVVKHFGIEEMERKCQTHEKYWYLHGIRDKLAKFRQEFHDLTGGAQKAVEELNEVDKQIKEHFIYKENAIELKLLLSFVIQMGYTVGSRAMGLENDGKQLKKLLELYSCLEWRQQEEEHAGKSFNGIIILRPIVYLEAQFLYIEGNGEGKSVVVIKFNAPIRNSSIEDEQKKLKIFKTLKEMLKWKNRSMSVIKAIDLLELLAEKKSDERIDMKTECISESVQSLMKAWSAVESSTAIENDIAALFSLKRLGRDLAQHLLEVEQLKQGYFKLFPAAVGKLRELVDKLEEGMEICQKEMDEASRQGKGNITPWSHMHFDELVSVEFGLDKSQTEPHEGSVLDIIGHLKGSVVKLWRKRLLEYITEDYWENAVWAIFNEKDDLDTSYKFKTCRLDKAVNQALEAFSEEVVKDLAQNVSQHMKQCGSLEGNIKTFKKDLDDKKKHGHKDTRILELRLENARKEFTETKKQLDDLKSMLVGLVNSILKALGELKAKAELIVVVNHLPNQIVELESKVRAFIDDFEKVKHEKGGKTVLNKAKKKLEEAEEKLNKTKTELNVAKTELNELLKAQENFSGGGHSSGIEHAIVVDGAGPSAYQ